MSQCQQILQVLSDGREHEMRDIHRLVGFCRLNSRVTELRSRGHEITCRKSGGSYFYRLVLDEAASAKVAASPCQGSSAASSSTPSVAPNPALFGTATNTAHSGRDGAGVLTLFEAKTW